MEKKFSAILSELRKDKGLSQRQVASDLRISQALLSHYENGAREPGLIFVCRACDYYGVSADRILGRSPDNGAFSGPAGAAMDILDHKLTEIGSEKLRITAESCFRSLAEKLAGILSEDALASVLCADADLAAAQKQFYTEAKNL